MTPDHDEPGAEFDRLAEVAAADGPEAMLERLAASLARRGRWHALFDLRMVQARHALGLPPTGDVGPLDEGVRERLDELSLAACREVGWPLLEAGEVAAAWMYLRAAAPADEVARRLAALADRFVRPPTGGGQVAGGEPVETPASDADGEADDEETARLVQEILGVALWESADPALGIEIVLGTQGTCNAVTAYEQAVSRLPAARQEPAARVLVGHLHAEVVRNLAFDLGQRGIDTAGSLAAAAPLAALLDAAGGLDDASIHVDVSHLQSVLRIARVCTDEVTLRRAWELARYACRLPEEVTYPGEPPFENVGDASRLFFAAQSGIEADAAVAFFRRAAATADPVEAGTLPADVLVLLLHRLGRAAEALRAAVDRPRGSGQPSPFEAAGMLPPLVELAAASGQWDLLLDACRRHGDEITFAAALAARNANQNQLGRSQPQP
jgi:hypothetical protein